MYIQMVIDRLRREREALSIAILALEKVSTGSEKKRGRPRKEWAALSMEIERQLEPTSTPAKAKLAKAKVMSAGQGADSAQ